MSTTQTTNLLLDKPGVGDTSWGTVLNGTLDRVDTVLSKKGTSNPTGVTTPDYIGQHFIDTTNAKAYVAKGATSADWVLLNAAVAPHHNICINGMFEVWQRGSAQTTAAVGSYNYLADRIFVRPAGALIKQERFSTSGLTGAKTRYCLLLTGQSAGTTTVEVGQRLESANVSQLRADGFTVSVEVYNGSGSDFTPTFEIKTPGAVDNFGSVSLVTTLSPGIVCTNAAWTRVYASANAATVGGWANLDNGLQIAVVIPSGHLQTAHTVRIAQMQFQEGTTLTTFLPRLRSEVIALCQRYYWKTYDLDTPPGTSTYAGVHSYYSSSGGADWNSYIPFKITMRTTPTISFYSPAGTLGKLLAWTTELTATYVSNSNDGRGTNGTIVTNSEAAPGSLNFYVHAVADAEL